MTTNRLIFLYSVTARSALTCGAKMEFRNWSGQTDEAGEIRQAMRIVTERRQYFLTQWSGIHG